jgi:hypothetical protein
MTGCDRADQAPHFNAAQYRRHAAGAILIEVRTINPSRLLKPRLRRYGSMMRSPAAASRE